MLDIKDLKAGYGDKTVIDLPFYKVSSGSRCLIRGESGSGKTTLLYAIAGLAKIQSGEINIEGTNIGTLSETALDRLRGAKIGIVFQNLNLIKSLTVLENILLGSFVNRREQNIKHAKELLRKLDIYEHHDRPATEISQGQAQRVAIVRALLNSPKLLLADEPTSSLDKKSAHEVIDLLVTLSKDSRATLLVSTHDERIMGSFEQVLDLGKAA